MSAAASLIRMATMDRGELRFRLECEARRALTRVRYAVRPPRVSRRHVTRLLDPAAGPLIVQAIASAEREDYLAAHMALAEHFSSRASRWPLQAARRAALTDEIRLRYPDAAREARRRADRIVDGRHDLLGYRDVRLGNPPDWHADAVHGRRAPLDFWSRVSYLDPAIGDHKVIWETNRHQYWMWLGTAYWLTGDRRFRGAAVAHLEDWIGANPPLTGVNWASMLELGFRSLSWTWAVEFFCSDSQEDAVPWLVDLLVSLDQQLAHVAQNLSQYFSPNTHLSGEGLALYAASTAFPELRRSGVRADVGRTVLLREARRQIRPDGGHAELSTHYQRYSTDFYLLALMVARAAGDPAAGTFEEAARAQATYLRTMADDRGHLPVIGDDDGGQLFRFGGRAPADVSASLRVAASLLGDPALAVGPPSEDVSWILGRSPNGEPARGAPAPWPSRVLRDSGYFVSRTAGGGHLVFDAGPHGFLNGGHAHADALSVVLTVEGEALFVDPGTATYTMDAGMRDRFRSSRMHNTLVLDGRDHAEPSGPFHWHTRTDARMLIARVAPRLDFAAGTHDAYGPRRHVRAIAAIHGIGWLVADRVGGSGEAAADTWWHLHPSWHAVVRGGACALRSASGRRLGFASTARDLAIVNEGPIAACALEYGRIERATVIRASHAARGPFVIGAFIPASAALSDPLAIVEQPTVQPEDAGWVASRFRITAGELRLEVTIAFPADSNTHPDPEAWPQPCIDELRAAAARRQDEPARIASICVE